MRFLILVALFTISLIYADRSGLAYLGNMLTEKTPPSENNPSISDALAHAKVGPSLSSDGITDPLSAITSSAGTNMFQDAQVKSTEDDIEGIAFLEKLQQPGSILGLKPSNSDQEQLPPSGFANARPTSGTQEKQIAIF